MDKKKYGKAYKKLVQRTVIALLLLLGVFFVKQFVTQYQITQEINTSYIINIAGRQRMLSQKIVKDIVFIDGDESGSGSESYKIDLEKSLELWKESHLELLELNQLNGSLAKDNRDICQSFQDLEPSFVNIVQGAEGFLRGIETNEQDLYLSQVIANELIFLEQMDSIVGLYEEEATKSVKAMKTTHMFLFSLILIILTFIGFKIFLPLLRYVDNAFDKVRESSDNLTKMFHSMKGAFFVIRRDGQILFMNRDTEGIISKQTGPNETLYLDKDVNWIEFNIMDLIQKIEKEDLRIDAVETTIQGQDGQLIVFILSAFPGRYNGQDVVVLNLFDVTAQKKAEEILKNTALKDELTGLYNRHFLESIIDGEIDRAQRYDIPLSVALLDLDYFKRVNDQWGHPVGDTVLKFTADIARNNIRSSDFAIRIGGEEFLIVMPNTDSKGALATAEKIRQAIEASVHPVVGSFTASFGVAERMNNEKYQYLHERVDSALYQAKESGRNRVSLADSESCECGTVAFEWNDKWNCGEAKIDQQHLELFQIASHLVKNTKATDNKQTSVKELKELIGAVAGHFEYEEKVLKQGSYKDIYKHKTIHTQLLKTAKEIKHAVGIGDLDPKKAFELIFDEVIVGHLLCEDVKFYPYITSAGD